MNMLDQIESYQEDRRVIQVACAKCRQWIANARIGELDLPLKGSMFEPRIGCESWEMPEPNATGMDLVCPHSVTGDPGDLHLFIPHIPGKELEADELCIHRSVETIKVEKQPELEIEEEICPCGCGNEAIVNHKSGNKYAHAGCHLRWLYKK